MRFGRPRQAAALPDADKALGRISYEMRRAIRAQGNGVLVKATDILALIASADRTEPVETHQAPDPRADPITGCMPVTAEGPQP